MLVESKPLHKKKNRIKKVHSNDSNCGDTSKLQFDEFPIFVRAEGIIQ